MSDSEADIPGMISDETDSDVVPGLITPPGTDDSSSDWTPPLTPKASTCREESKIATPTTRRITTPSTAVVTPTATRVKPRADYHPGWDVKDLTGSRMVTLAYIASGATYSVPANKQNKAAGGLDPDSLHFLINPQKQHCQCSRLCGTMGLTATDVLKIRKSIFETEEPSVIVLAKILRLDNAALVSSDGTIADGSKLAYKICGKAVCGRFWGTVMTTSDHTLRKARRFAKSGNFITGHAGRGLSKQSVEAVDGEASASLKCHAFWKHYLDTLCQRSNDTTRLFPTEQTFGSIYLTHFLPYAVRLGWVDAPGERLFRKVCRTHPDFADVKTKKKHTHVRCAECTDCKELLLRGFKNAEDLEALNARWKCHQDAVRSWRECENFHTQRAQSAPHEVNVLKFDDTESLGFPHLTRRPRKVLPLPN